MLNHNQVYQVLVMTIPDAEIQPFWLSREILHQLKVPSMLLLLTLVAMRQLLYSVYLIKRTTSSASMMYTEELKDILEKFTLHKLEWSGT